MVGAESAADETPLGSHVHRPAAPTAGHNPAARAASVEQRLPESPRRDGRAEHAVDQAVALAAHVPTGASAAKLGADTQAAGAAGRLRAAAAAEPADLCDATSAREEASVRRDQEQHGRAGGRAHKQSGRQVSTGSDEPPGPAANVHVQPGSVPAASAVTRGLIRPHRQTVRSAACKLIATRYQLTARVGDFATRPTVAYHRCIEIKERNDAWNIG